MITRKLSCIAALLICTSGPVVAEEQTAAVVELATVTEGNSGSVLRLPGSVISTRDAQISAELSGERWLHVAQSAPREELIRAIEDKLDRYPDLTFKLDWSPK